MSTSGEHLSQETLSGKAMEVLEELAGLLKSLDFKPERETLYRCNDQAALSPVVQRLTGELHFITRTNPAPGYNAFRIPIDESGKVEPPTIRISTGPAYLIPVRIIKGTPTVSSKPFQPGKATLITSSVKVRPALDFLVIALPS